VDYYHRAGVPFYVIADVLKDNGKERRIELSSYQRTPSRYKRVKPDKRSWIWLDPLRLWLGPTRDRLGGYNRLSCFDPDTGQRLGDYSEISNALAEARALAKAQSAARASAKARPTAEARLRAEVQARAKAEARIRELVAELKQSRARGS
jgi:hypothetical protein